MTGRRFLMSMCVLALVLSEASAQTATHALDQFKANNPGARFYGSQFYQPVSSDDEARGGMTAVYGTILSTGETPEQSAWNHFNELRGALGTEIGTMVPEVRENGALLQGVMWNKATEAHKFYTLRFNQYYGDIPVYRSGVGFLVRNQKGSPLVMSGFTVKDLTGARIVTPAEGARPSVTRVMKRNVHNLMDAAPVERSVLQGKRRSRRLPLTVSRQKFVVFAGVDGEFAEPELAVEFLVRRGSIDTLPDYHKYMVVASVATGEILHEETMICHCGLCMPVDVDGKVEGRATQGLNALECDPEATVPLPYAEVAIGGTSVNTDANGNYTVPNGGSSNVNVTSYLRGTWFEVFDESAGGATPSLTQNVTPPGPANFLHNPTAGNDLMTANVNTYVEANIVRDFVLNYEPTFPVIWNQTGFDINTNIASSCNAFYDGSSINFYQNGGGCNNTAFSDVVHHEYGHHLINVSNNGQGQMGEGSGDVMGVLIQDDPVLGQGFSTCGQGIRTANNTLQYPCSGSIHHCGQLLSGCVWDTLNELKVTEPSSAIDISAQLFLGMLIVRGQMDPGQATIAPDITVIYLELDDDNGNIGDGTPHYDEIATGFGLHNMDAPPLDLIDFNFPSGLPELIPHNGAVAFTVQVVPQTGTPQPGTGILHVDSGSGYQQYPMNETSPNVYEAAFPVLDCGDVVDFYVSAEAVGGTIQTSPATAPAEFYTAMVGDSIATTFYDDAETDAGWSVSGDAVDGQWDRGVPAGGGDRGDPANDGDGSGSAWLTDNEDGNSDVDDGSTILTSPVLNAVGAPNEIALISYQRFYSNNFGNDPLNDVFVVEISNDGGSTWVNLETVGPTGTEVTGGWIQKTFKISDFVTPSNNMQVRFNASDLNDGSVVEAGVDGLEIMMVTCEDPGIPPFADKFLDGVVEAGSLSDVFSSDDVDYELEPSATTNPLKQKIEVIFAGESPIVSPTSFGFRVEASMIGGPEGDVIQVVELRNEITGHWEVVDTRAATNTDSVVTGAGAGDLTRFIHPLTDEVTAKVTWTSPEFTGASFDWSVDLDEAVWVIE